jgi:pyruvate ferredoxin oxidoreductase gamma subunit
MDTKEIRFHGRGGQGVVTAAELMAVAAFEDGKYAQAFPSFGSERMGAPVQSFLRIADEKIRGRYQIIEPDYLVVQDPTLILTGVPVFNGLKDDGVAIVNTERSPDELGIETKARILTLPATKIALEILGRPIMNTTLMGAFAGATGLISTEGIARAIRHRFPEPIAEKNVVAVEKAYEMMKGAL